MIVIHKYKGFNIVKTGTPSYPWNVYKEDGHGFGEHVSFGKTLKDCKSDIDNMVFMLDDSSSLEEHYTKYGSEYCWESTLVEDLIEEDWFNEQNNPNFRAYEPKDIVMVNDKTFGTHRILIITKKDNQENNPVYSGYILSSNINKANKYSKYENNIYIKNYSTILQTGAKNDKEAIIKLDELKSFTKDAFSASGTYKGTVTDEFFNFILSCIQNIKRNITNKEITWEK